MMLVAQVILGRELAFGQLLPAGPHSTETGLVTLRQLLLHAINHLRHHLRFVAEKRAAMKVL